MPFGARRLFLFSAGAFHHGRRYTANEVFCTSSDNPGGQIASCTFVLTKQYKQVVFLWPQNIFCPISGDTSQRPELDNLVL